MSVSAGSYVGKALSRPEWPGRPTEWPQLLGKDAAHAEKVIAVWGYDVEIWPEVSGGFKGCGWINAKPLTISTAGIVISDFCICSLLSACS